MLFRSFVSRDAEDRVEVREGLKHFLRDWSEEGDFTARFVLFNIMANEQSHITNLTFMFLLP